MKKNVKNQLEKWGSIFLLFSLSILLCLQWIIKDNSYQPNLSQLESPAKVKSYLEKNWNNQNHGQDQPVLIPTGIFISSLKFINAVDVNVTGYVWQKLNKINHKKIIEEIGQTGDPNIIFPQSVESSAYLMMETAYERESGENNTVFGWYFEVTLRQNFDYSKYPLDHKTIWIRIIDKDFDSNIILTPDLESYDSTALVNSFGIEKSIVVDGWSIEDCYFDYQLSNYDTDFGINKYIGQKGFPELQFNIVVKRNFSKPFIVNLIPLVIIAIILFAVLMTTTYSKKTNHLFGFNTTGAIGTCAGLFFTIMLSHIQLRNEIPGNGVYLEYFYLIMYVVTLLVSLNAYFVSLFASKERSSFLLNNDNRISKLLYWPLLLGILNIITLVCLFF